MAEKNDCQDKQSCDEGCGCEPNPQQDLQQKFSELQMMAQHHGQLQKHIEQVSGQIQELNGVIESLNEIKEIKEGAEILVPVTNGIFAPATLSSTSKLMMNVGGGSVVEKSVDEAIAMLKKQESELLVYQTQLSAQSQAFESRLHDIQSQIQNMKV